MAKRVLSKAPKCLFFAGTLLLCTSASELAARSAAGPIESTELSRELDAYFSKAAAMGFNGVVLVGRGGRVIFRKAYGWSDREAKLRSSAGGVYAIGSLQKQFTATAVLKLASQRKLSLTDPISRWFPNVPADKAHITVHQLLTHTSGLQNSGGRCMPQTTRDEYVSQALAGKLEHSPGEVCSYSNAGYNLLAAVVEKASGRDFEQYMTEEVWRPAGLRETGILSHRWDRAKIAIGYRNNQRWGTIFENVFGHTEWPILTPNGRRWCGMGSGATSTTADDLWRWHRALAAAKVLPPPQMRQLFTPQVGEEPGPSPGSWYSYGWSIRDKAGDRSIGHDGAVNDIYAVNFVWLVNARTTYIVLSNAFSERQNAIALSGGLEKLVWSNRQ